MDQTSTSPSAQPERPASKGMVLAAKRFEVNRRRITHLGHLLIWAKRSGASAEAVDDLLRLMVVHMHASFEDCLRTLARWRLAHGDADDFKAIGLPGLPKAEKFHLGALVKYKGQTVEEVLQKSVNEHVAHLTLNNVGDVKRLLAHMKIDAAPFDELFEHLAWLIERRHKIVHEADMTDPDAAAPTPLMAVEPMMMQAGAAAMYAFAYKLFSLVLDGQVSPEDWAEIQRNVAETEQIMWDGPMGPAVEEAIRAQQGS